MSKNDVTGDNIVTAASSEAYRSGWDRIFGAKIDKTATEHGDIINGDHQGHSGGLHAGTAGDSEAGGDSCGDEQSAEG